METNENYNLVMPFLDESKTFCNGFECGKLYQQMRFGEMIDTMVHYENKAQLELCCEVNGYEYEFTFTSQDEWLRMIATPIKSVPSQAPKK